MSGAGSVDPVTGAGAGHEFPEEEVSWLKRDVLLFANSIGCTADELHFLYVCIWFVWSKMPSAKEHAHRSFTPSSPSFLPILSSSVSLPIDAYSLSCRGADRQKLRLPNLAAFKNTTQEVIDFYAKSGLKPIPGVPKFDPRRIVDGQRMMQFLKPLPPTSEGKKFVLKSKVIGVYDKGKAGSVVETESLIMDKNTGEVGREGVFCREIRNSLVMGKWTSWFELLIFV